MLNLLISMKIFSFTDDKLQCNVLCVSFPTYSIEVRVRMPSVLTALLQQQYNSTVLYVISYQSATSIQTYSTVSYGYSAICTVDDDVSHW